LVEVRSGSPITGLSFSQKTSSLAFQQHLTVPFKEGPSPQPRRLPATFLPLETQPFPSEVFTWSVPMEIRLSRDFTNFRSLAVTLQVLFSTDAWSLTKAFPLSYDIRPRRHHLFTPKFGSSSFFSFPLAWCTLEQDGLVAVISFQPVFP